MGNLIPEKDSLLNPILTKTSTEKIVLEDSFSMLTQPISVKSLNYLLLLNTNAEHVRYLLWMEIQKIHKTSSAFVLNYNKKFKDIIPIGGVNIEKLSSKTIPNGNRLYMSDSETKAGISEDQSINGSLKTL